MLFTNNLCICYAEHKVYTREIVLKRILSAFLLCLCVLPVWAGSCINEIKNSSAKAAADSYARDEEYLVWKSGDKYYRARCSWGKNDACNMNQYVAVKDPMGSLYGKNGVHLYMCSEHGTNYTKGKWTHRGVIPECSQVGWPYCLKWNDSLLNRVDFILRDYDKEYTIGGAVMPSGCYTHKCKEGYVKKGDKCIKQCTYSDSTIDEGDEVESTDLGACKTAHTDAGWSEGVEQIASCSAMCSDQGTMRYTITSCTTGYTVGISNNKVTCVQRSGAGQGAKDGAGEDATLAAAQSDANSNGAQSAISASKQSCLESRDTDEGKACCHWASTVAYWENNKCVCVDTNKEFKMNDDGTGECVDKPAGASQLSDEEYTEPTCGNCVAMGNCSDRRNRNRRIDGTVSAECNETDNQERRAWGVLQQKYSAGQGRVTGVTVKVGDDTCAVDSYSVFDCGDNKYAGCTMVEISGGGYKTITVPLNKITDGGTASSYICLEPENCNCGTDGEVSDANAVVVGGNSASQGNGDNSGAQGTGDNSGVQGAGGNSALQNAPAKPDGTLCTPTDKNAKSAKWQGGKCVIDACNEGYELKSNECVVISGPCETLPQNAKAANRVWDAKTKSVVCLIVECKESYYKVSDDKKSCVEDKKAKSQAKIDELQKNADAMKEKEQSTANKLLGGAAIGATGIGAMQAASAYSEQQADEEAEQAMKAYLATFHCNYGGGINVPGGEKDVQLPGGNELIDLYAEYVNLANNLKVRKAALDLRPGIESEAILDSATSGLYDDVAIGKTSGAFTSLARALQDPEGEDAKAWAAQKDASAKKMKTGLTIAGIGAIGGAVGNLLINRNSEKENSKNILDKYKDGDLTGKVSKSPDGKLVAEPVNKESKLEQGIAIQDKDLGQETNMNQNQNGNWVHIVKTYAVGFYCEDLFEKVYRSCFAMNNEDYARFQQSRFSEITNNAEKCYQGLVNCKQDSHTLANIEEVCIRGVASEFRIDVSGVNNANCTDNYKTDFTWKSHIFQERSTVNADATAIVEDGQMIVGVPDPSTGKIVETVVEETQESTPKQDNVVTDYHHGDKVEYIKRIENITDANAAFNMLAQQFGKTPSDEVKNTYDGFVQKCNEYNGVLSIELDTLRRYERDMYQVLCYFPDLDQTPEIVKVAYNANPRVLDNSVSISEGIRLSKQAPFKDTQYKQNEDKFWQRLTEFNSTWSTSSRNCKIPELPSLWKCTKYSAMIRIHDRDGKMYLEMTKYDGPGGNSDNYFVGKR